MTFKSVFDHTLVSFLLAFNGDFSFFNNFFCDKFVIKNNPIIFFLKFLIVPKWLYPCFFSNKNVTNWLRGERVFSRGEREFFVVGTIKKIAKNPHTGDTESLDRCGS